MKGWGVFFSRVHPTSVQTVDNLLMELETFRDCFDPFLDIPYWIGIYEDLDKVSGGDTLKKVRRRSPRRARGTPPRGAGGLEGALRAP